MNSPVWAIQVAKEIWASLAAKVIWEIKVREDFLEAKGCKAYKVFKAI